MPTVEKSKTTETPKTAPSQWALVRRLLGLVWRYRWRCVGVLALQSLLMTLGLAGLSLVGLGVDFIRFAHGGTVGVAAHAVKPPAWPLGIQPPDDWAASMTILAVAGAIVLVAGIRSSLNYYYTVAAAKLVQAKVVVDLRAAVYDKLQRLSFRFFDANASGSIINRVTGDVQSVRMFVDQVVLQSIVVLVSLVVYLVYMVHIHVGLTIACLATTPLIALATARFSRHVRPRYTENRELMDAQVRALSENLLGVQVVKGFFRQEEEVAKYQQANRKLRDQQNATFRIVSRFAPAVGFLSNLNLAVLLGYGGYLVIRYEQTPVVASALQVGLTIGQFLVFSGLLQQFSGQVNSIVGIANSMQQSLTGAERVFEVMDTPVEIQSPPDAIKLERLQGDVEFDHVSFAYHAGEPVLEDVSFRVPHGHCIAILGATGSGKSALLGLIPRFYDAQSGAVRIDGIDVRKLHVEELRRHIGVVFQESFLFSNTISANIAFGHPNATQAKIERAARIAAAHDFIMALPKGYDTVLAEAGNSLSGGQRQRLAIARALLLEPAILILDDPTAAIDARTEEEILVALEQAMQGRTTFLVTHRISALRRADLVIVLAHGRVVDTGTHAELMQRTGDYRDMALLQAPEDDVRRARDATGRPLDSARVMGGA